MAKTITKKAADIIDRTRIVDFIEKEISRCEEDFAESCGDDFFEMAVRSRITALEHVLQEITNAPAADVAEVKHGSWAVWENAPTIYGSDTLYVCTVCTAKYTEKSRYCGYCGAKIDLEEQLYGENNN